MKALVTGFGPFPGQPRNATAEIVEGLDVPGVDVRTIVLPVAWNIAPEIALREARAFGAELVVMCGVSGQRGVLKVECGGSTAVAPKEDVKGAIIAEIPGPPVRTTLDVRAAVRAARRAIRERASIFGDVLVDARLGPIRESNNYVCNHLSHRVLSANVAPSGFLHWPGDLSPAQIPAARHVLAKIIQAQR